VTTLLIDIGNARVKWAWREGGAVGPVHRSVHRGDPQGALDAIAVDLRSGPGRVVIANVAGAVFAERFAGVISRETGIEPTFVKSKASGFGVRNAYARPERLGVDRWMAMIAAHARTLATRPGDSSCVIDAGTAVTFDAIRDDGQHLGGLIIAGPRLQAETLGARTSDIGSLAAETRCPRDGLELLGRSTEQAVSHGAWLAAAGALSRARETVARALGREVVCYLCGGDAGKLRDWLDFRVSLLEDLVLEGLALVDGAEDRM
jgi:type III pantothenate kinase